MTRALLCVALSVACVLLALATALQQNKNRTRALELDALKEECSMIEAINGDRLEQILEKDWAPLPYSPRTKPEAGAHADAETGRADS